MPENKVNSTNKDQKQEKLPFKDFLRLLPQVWSLAWQSGRFYAALFLGIGIIRSLVPAASLWVSKLVIDAIIKAVQGGGALETRYLLWLIVLQFLLSLAENYLGAARSYSRYLLGVLLMNRVQLDTVKKAGELDLSRFEDDKFYDRMQKTRDYADNSIYDILLSSEALVMDFVTGASMLWLILRFSPWLILLLAVAMVPSFVFNLKFSKQRYFITSRQVPESRHIGYLTNLMTRLESVKEVKLFELGAHFIERFRGTFNKFFRERREMEFKRMFGWFGVDTLSQSAYYAGYVVIIRQALRGFITIGDLTLYIRAFSQCQSSFERLLFDISNLYERGLFMRDYFAFMAEEPRIVSKVEALPFPTKLSHGIELKNVSFVYPGTDKEVLRDINLWLKPEQSVAFVGCNGAGKTTLVKLLARLYEPTKGQILIDGIDYRDYDLPSLHKAFGVIFQDFVQYQELVKENIGYGDLARLGNQDEIITAAKLAQADEFVEKLPQKYDTLLGRQFEGGIDLSFGQWQRLALARVFFSDAPVMILDEPTASMDAEAEYSLYHEFEALAAHRILVLISHRFSTVRMADVIYVIDDGRITEQGSHAELLSQKGEYARLFNLQAAGYQ